MGGRGRVFVRCHGLLDALDFLDKLLEFTGSVLLAMFRCVLVNPCLVEVDGGHEPPFAHPLVRLVNHTLQLQLCAALARLARSRCRITFDLDPRNSLLVSSLYR